MRLSEIKKLIHLLLTADKSLSATKYLRPITKTRKRGGMAEINMGYSHEVQHLECSRIKSLLGLTKILAEQNKFDLAQAAAENAKWWEVWVTQETRHTGVIVELLENRRIK